MEPVSFIQKYRIQKLVKAMKTQASGKASTAPGVGAGGQQADGFPVGTVRNGRQKVSMHPSKWVDVSTGKGYDSHEHGVHEHHKAHEHDELSKIKETTMSKLKNHLYSDDLEHAERKLNIFLQKRLDAKNMMSAANVESSKLGAVPKDHQERYYKIREQADKAKENFVNFVQKAKERAKVRKTNGG